jgi:fatty acid desaturase
MQSLPVVITDPVYKEPGSYNWYDRFWLKHLNDKRDIPFTRLLTIIHLTIIPTAIILYTPLLQGWWWWGVAAVYFYFAQFYFKGPFGLMLHCLCHRKTFKAGQGVITKYIHWFVCPFFGHLGDAYFSHHLGMHHIEGNMPDDTSSTMAYQRDSLKDFLKYLGHFMILGPRDAFVYLFAKKRKKLYRQLSINEIGFFVIAAGLCFVNLKATLVIFVIPLLFARLVMMIGNWTQHAFVDPIDPEDDLASNIVCMNTIYNRKCWNDGYHAMHHIRPGAHYTEYPVLLQQVLPQMTASRGLIFLNIHYLHIFFYLMRKRYDKLAAHLVNLNKIFNSEQEAIELMKSRTRKFSPQQLKQIASPVEARQSA